jgi:hypothetical protein
MPVMETQQSRQSAPTSTGMAPSCHRPDAEHDDIELRTDAVLGWGPSCAEVTHSGTARPSGRAQLAAV